MSYATHNLRIVVMAACSTFILSCASSSNEIAATYVSPSKYSSFNCEQLSQELARLNKRKNDLAFELDEKASSDEGLTAVSLILFWPAAFALGGNQGQEAEYASIKGEYDAVQKVGVEKTCNLDPTKIQTAKVKTQSSSSGSISAIEFYGEAEAEVNTNTYDNDLWAKALVDVEGDEVKRKAKYIELRANQLYSEKVGIASGTSIYEQPEAAESQVILDYSGNYRSKITGSSRHKSAFVIEQDGNRIKGRSLNKEWEIEGYIEEDSLVFKWWSPGNKGNGKFTIDSYGNMAGSYLGDSWGKGEWILVRNDEQPGMMVVAPGSNSTLKTQSTTYFDISGTYVSDITTNNNWRFQRPKDRRLKITISQNGNEITGTNRSKNLKISGVIEGDVISYFTWPSEISSDEINGKWKINPDGVSLTGNWTHPHGGGKWNLTRVE